MNSRLRRPGPLPRPLGAGRQVARRPGRSGPSDTEAERVLGAEEASLLDIVDNVLNKGVVVSGDITLALAQVDLVYARLSLLLCAADRVLPSEDHDPLSRRHQRRIGRARAAREE